MHCYFITHLLKINKYLLNHFPLPSFSTVNRLKQSELDSLKALKLLQKSGKISENVILIADEMYLQKSSQYHSGKYVGADADGNLYKGVMVFMVVGLKESVPVVINAFPETSVTGEWIASKLDYCITSLAKKGFKVRGVVTDNHSANAKAFQVLTAQYPSSFSLCIKHPINELPTYLFFDNVHIMKNIRNNLLNAKKFVFPAFSLDIMKDKNLASDGGYICWSDLHGVHDRDKALQGYLRKAPELTYAALHPGNNKQNVPLALGIFHETTIAAFKCYYPERKEAAEFLTLINAWWTIINARTQYSNNVLANAIVLEDGKADYLHSFASWLEKWSLTSRNIFSLSKQTFDALIRTLKAQSNLIKDLHSEGFKFVIPRRFQSDPLEKRFAQYRQMSGGRFLVSLREVQSSEKILLIRSMIKEDINFWEEDIFKLKSFYRLNLSSMLKTKTLKPRVLY